MVNPVSVVVSNLYMEDHEKTAMATAPPEMKSKICIDPTDSIKFKDEMEVGKTIPFLDAQITRNDYGT